ncbi:MAG: glycoside hydrolase family 2 TIM barrel-domain containing protein [bacterium]|nr:glycoside hydrolase family 2 TIM barrel-domain containing protein [bacterium]
MGGENKGRSFKAIISAAGLLVFLTACKTLPPLPPIPAVPATVRVDGHQLKVHQIREDGTLKAETNYVIKGVCWSVATLWPSETYPAGAPFEHDGRKRMWEMAKYDFPRIKEAGFNTIRLYVDPGLAKDSSLYFHEDTDHLLWQTDANGNIIYIGGYPVALDENGNGFMDWQDGMAMIGDQGENAVAQGLAVLDEAYRNGLKVIMVVDGLNCNTALAQKIINTYKNHPALLFWSIGNEFNYNFNDQQTYMWRYTSFEAACQAVNDLAGWIKSNDPNHPVAACLGEPHYPSFERYKAGVGSLTNIDLMGLNLYKGKSFNPFYEMYADTVTWNKPYYFSEYGVDAWRYDPQPAKEFEDVVSQKEGISWQWSEMQNRLSSQDSNNSLLGGCAFEWVDEWWKLEGKNPETHDNDPGYPVNTGAPANTYLWPDGCMEEEYWGLNSQDSKTINPLVFYGDMGLIGEQKGGSPAWDFFTWGLPAQGIGYGKINSQADYISLQEGSRLNYSNFKEYAYTGGSGTGNTIPEGNRCTYTEIWGTNYGGGWGLFRTRDFIDLSRFANGNLKFWIKIQQATTPATPIGEQLKQDIFLKFEDETGPEDAVFIWFDESYCSEFNANSTAWQEITVPISALWDGHGFAWQDPYGYKHPSDSSHLAKLNLEKMKMVFSISSRPIRIGYGNTQYWIDHVRWDTGGTSGYNRRARPVISDYRNKYNALNYLKPVFEIGARSDFAASSAGITKNDSLIWDFDASSYTCVLAAAFDPDNGRLINKSMKQLTSIKQVNDWIDQYDHISDNYILALAKHKRIDFLSQCVKLGTVGSTLYATVASNEPWVFIGHVVGGLCLAKKETKGIGNKAEASLVIPLDYDHDGIYNSIDQDTDGDGLTVSQEIRYGTSVTDQDTDDDGISDSAEVIAGTNPRNPDSKDLATDPQAKLVAYPLVLDWSNDEDERYIYLDNDGGESLKYKIYISDDWLSVKYRDHDNNEAWTAVTPESYLYDDLDDFILRVTLDRTKLTTPKTYTATIMILAVDEDGTGAGRKDITISVPVQPELFIAESDMVINRPETSRMINVENNGFAAMNWSISQLRPVTWLTIAPASGTTLNETDPVDLTVDWSNITASTHTVMRVDAGNAGIKFITVNLDDPKAVRLSNQLPKSKKNRQAMLETNTEHIIIGQAEQAGTFKIRNAGGGTVTWTIGKDEDWITNISSAAGDTTGEEDIITVTVAHGSYIADQTGKVTIAWTDANNDQYKKDVYITMRK